MGSEGAAGKGAGLCPRLLILKAVGTTRDFEAAE